jgi:hypothetical protein
MVTIDRAQVQLRLGLGSDQESWVRHLEELGPPPRQVSLPAGEDLEAVLRRVAIVAEDAPQVAASAPTPEERPELWWLLERAQHQQVLAIGDPEATFECPLLPADLGPEGACFWIHVFISALGEIDAFHRKHGIPEDVAAATLRDLGSHVAINRRMHGITGLDVPGWESLPYRGILYALGRLQFNMYRLRTKRGPLFWEEDPALLEEVGFRVGDPVLGAHIPETGPMTPEGCRESLSWAGRFFDQYFPEADRRLIICSSWLLDEQLAELLPESSNIVQFQRLFHLVPGGREGDGDVFKFVFRQVDPDVDQLPQRTTLERAVVRHLREGRHFQLRTGWIRLSDW